MFRPYEGMRRIREGEASERCRGATPRTRDRCRKLAVQQRK